MTEATDGAPRGAAGTIWHDLECGSYEEDLPVWRSLAQRFGSPVLDVGAGSGRVALDLARAGHRVTAVDLDPQLVAAMRDRARGLPVTALVADARSLALGERFALCIVPMQTIQLLGGSAGRRALLSGARDHLRPGGAVAIALADELELFDVTDGALGPLPDVAEIAGIVYSSAPVAVRADTDGYVLERRRETVDRAGGLTTERDVIHLDRLAPRTVEHEAAECGLRAIQRLAVAATADYAGSTVVVLGG